jgi:hypothetical protein
MRVLDKSFRDEGGWHELWQSGGISMRLGMDPGIVCDSPDGDWQTFARTYLDKPDDSSTV